MYLYYIELLVLGEIYISLSFVEIFGAYFGKFFKKLGIGGRCWRITL
jgi:hypothetical protein